MTMKVDKFKSTETGHVVNVKVYDKPEFYDRYTVVFTGVDYSDYYYWNRYALLASSYSLCGHAEVQEGSHLGKRIPFAELPEHVQYQIIDYINS